jgi:hypothetical protein
MSERENERKIGEGDDPNPHAPCRSTRFFLLRCPISIIDKHILKWVPKTKLIINLFRKHTYKTSGLKILVSYTALTKNICI